MLFPQELTRALRWAPTPPERGPPPDLRTGGTVEKGHGRLENRLLWRRDVMAREDNSRVRSGSAPQAMAAIRNTTLFMTRRQPGSLRSVRAALAEDRCSTTRAAIKGLL